MNPAIYFGAAVAQTNTHTHTNKRACSFYFIEHDSCVYLKIEIAANAACHYPFTVYRLLLFAYSSLVFLLPFFFSSHHNYSLLLFMWVFVIS